MNDSEQFRRECEARCWLQRTNGDPAKIKALLLRIEAKRGKDAVEVLRQDMRAAWADGVQRVVENGRNTGGKRDA